MLKEFRDFAVRGNVVDMAVGIIIGAAFGKIVTAVVQNLVTPVLGLLIGGINFSDLKIVLTEAQGDVPEVALSYGVFLQSTIDFVIVAFAIFLLIKGLNKFKRQEAAAVPPAPSNQEVLLTEIRDLLRKKA
jgi:large conductance mechanosensitive channel